MRDKLWLVSGLEALGWMLPEIHQSRDHHFRNFVKDRHWTFTANCYKVPHFEENGERQEQQKGEKRRYCRCVRPWLTCLVSHVFSSRLQKQVTRSCMKQLTLKEISRPYRISKRASMTGRNLVHCWKNLLRRSKARWQRFTNGGEMSKGQLFYPCECSCFCTINASLSQQFCLSVVKYLVSKSCISCKDRLLRIVQRS